jgi:hypothetical protein
LTTFVLSNSANLDLSPESQIVLAIEQVKLSYMGEFIVSTAVDCTAEGVFVINCTSYKVCIATPGGFIGAEATCPAPQNFNPGTKQCDPNYPCPSCRREGFMCLTNTSFTLCSNVKEVVVWNVTCPSNHCCHEAYRLPCMSEKLTCLC